MKIYFVIIKISEWKFIHKYKIRMLILQKDKIKVFMTVTFYLLRKNYGNIIMKKLLDTIL